MKSKEVFKNVKIKNLICNFFKYIINCKSNEISHIANLQCGFEKWLQLEFVFWFIKKYNNLSKLNEDIGVERKMNINSSNRKTIDIWLRTTKNKYYYIEFKSIVEGWNEKKQISSWIKDFKLLQRIPKEEPYFPSGIASILFGSSKNEWESKWKDFKKFVIKSIKSTSKSVTIKKSGNLVMALLYNQY